MTSDELRPGPASSKSRPKLKSPLGPGPCRGQFVIDLDLGPEPGGDLSDLATKGEAAVRDIEASSAWQQGPAALQLEQDQWPASRDFTRKIPEEE